MTMPVISAKFATAVVFSMSNWLHVMFTEIGEPFLLNPSVVAPVRITLGWQEGELDAVELVAVEDDVEFFATFNDVLLAVVVFETSDAEVDDLERLGFPCDLVLVWETDE
jgi:hypothetical protein